MPDPQIRPERATEAETIGELISAAFRASEHGLNGEARIVERLRADQALSLSLVALVDGQLSGHVAVSAVQIADSSPDWYGLGPLSVLPARQRQGLGASLMKAALSRLREAGAAGCLLVGDPAYYGRFGFAARAGLHYPGIPAAYCLALPFGPSWPRGAVRYHAAFATAA